MNPFFPQGGICRLFWWTQLDLSWVWGVREGQNFFCCELWTHRHPLGVRPAPKSICTHQAHPLKLLAPKNGQIDLFRPYWTGAAWWPRWASEIKNGFKRVLWTLNHLLGCLDDVSHRLWKKIFALEKSSQNDPKATFPLGFRCKIFKNFFGPKMHEKTL